MIIWLYGMPSSGKTTLAKALKYRLPDFLLLDGDNLREKIGNELGYDEKSRNEQARRIIKYIKENNIENAILTTNSVSKKNRDIFRNNLEDLFQIYLECDIKTCRERDKKNLYKLFKEGKIENMPGEDLEFETPEDFHVRINTSMLTENDSLNIILKSLNIPRDILLITGPKRSGTNLVRALIGSTPFYNIEEEDKSSDFKRFRNELKNRNLDEIVFTNLYYRIFGGSLYGDTSFKNHNILQHGELLKNYDNVYILAIIRDVRGIYCSHKFGKGKEKKTNDMYKIYKKYTKLYRKWKAILGDRLIIIKYEDLVKDPYGVMENVMYKLNKPYSEEYLNYQERWNKRFHGCIHYNKRTNSSFPNMMTNNNLIYTDSINKWMDMLTDEEKREITELCKDELEYWGYTT
jgi:adenylylsulfate kinase-like enzyme